ncbi:hypothetical protein BDP81DRAFT_397380 [Colletotrichum phormii]|uniref:Secreted protein n=1 Tax=Colletotrichum phormii TaxID=359342 RepID=A0AAI9ZLP3_9PEZI|nr:uncharacterized protein BDP81DRAFT_397380 [Colletotrichum phormii]KAK1625581.1 hypothetical protein BDP81DRAFT_397380 [Colletotrichum phormii]
MQFFKIFIYNVLCLSLALAGVIDDRSSRSITSDTENQELKRTVPELVIITPNNNERLPDSTGNTERANFDNVAARDEDTQGGNSNSPRNAQPQMTDVKIHEAALNLTERDDPPQMSDDLANCVSCVWVCKTAATNILLPEEKLFHM